jgi:hypothetical protein
LPEDNEGDVTSGIFLGEGLSLLGTSRRWVFLPGDLSSCSCSASASSLRPISATGDDATITTVSSATGDGATVTTVS